MSSRDVPYLRAVSRPPPRKDVGSSQLQADAWQRTLFVSSNSNLIAFLEFDRLLEAEFLSLVLGAKAKFIIDLRLVPRFDLGSLNRKIVFSLFSQTGGEYRDLSGVLGVRDRRDANLNPAILRDHIEATFKASKRPIEGPILFLVDTPQFEESYVSQLSDTLQTLRPEGWEVLRAPIESGGIDVSRDIRRNLIFISHANPENNEFSRWLGLQLANEGYEIWSDVTKLIGGEQFWDSIEQAIRRYSAKVLVVLTRVAQEKQGVLDEINCAVTLERVEGLDGFVIPLRLDDIPFDQIRANLARKNVIDFSKNWAVGLGQLFAALKRDGVPKSNTAASNAVSVWHRENRKSHEIVQKVPEKLLTNWLEIKAMPPHVVLTKNSTGGIGQPSVGLHFVYGSYIGRLSALEGKGSDQVSFSLPEFFEGPQIGDDRLQPLEANKIAVGLLRQSWNAFAAEKGLAPYYMSSGAVAWYVPAGLIPGDSVPFKDLRGKSRKKYLVGKSQKRGVYWHYAIEVQAVIGNVNRLILQSHIAFTTDGERALLPSEKMHSLRRQFCKSWWNDRWRDLMIAFVTWISNNGKHWRMSAGEECFIELAGRPIEVKSPVSLRRGSEDDERVIALAQDLEWEDLDAGLIDDDEDPVLIVDHSDVGNSDSE
ncbi:toll/interleukin-1 receptor domain-containing protein [Hydrocarboniphaga effusa]|uniref:toll/interleukin-1 receptor domain-containing protein n=1 Tax=Hydrocarboniphaga effusa TaxID=243629 RepID=UPI0031379AA6